MESRIGRLSTSRLHRVLEVLPPELAQHVRVILSAKLFHDSRFDVRRESFVEPEVIPGCVRYEVSRPRVRELVSYETYKRPVTRENSRRCKCESRIFHPAIGERRRQNENVVATPAIRSIQLLSCSDHLVHFLELARCAIDNRWLCIYAGGLANGTE